MVYFTLSSEKQFISSIGGACSPDKDFPKYLKSFDDGLLDLNKMVTERYVLVDINDVPKALETGQLAERWILVF